MTTAHSSKQLETMLRRLERQYDRGGEPQREYAKACRELHALLSSNKIDYEHARILHASAEERLNQSRREQSERRQLAQRAKSEAAMLPFVFTGLFLFCCSIIAWVMS